MDDQKLIECVRAHECLYDQSVKEYRQKNARSSAWKQVAEQMDSTASECKKQWTNLRNAYLHAVSRRKKPGNSFSKWKYADEMSFLLPFFIPKQQPTAGQDENLDDSLNSNEADSEVTDDGSVLIINEENMSTGSSSNENISRDDLIVEILKHMKEPEKDEIDLFFASMAATVRQLPKIKQIQLKRQIFQIVNEAEMRLLSENKDTMDHEQNNLENDHNIGLGETKSEPEIYYSILSLVDDVDR